MQFFGTGLWIGILEFCLLEKTSPYQITGMILTPCSFALSSRTGNSLFRTYFDAKNAGLTKTTAARAPLQCFWMCACQSSPSPMS